MTADGGLLACNGTASDLIAQGHGEALGELARDCLLERQALATTRSFPGDGHPRHIVFHCLPVGERRAPSACLLLGHDLTVEHNLRMALADSRERYRDLVRASATFAWETDTHGRFVFVSPEGALGYSAAELVGEAPGRFLAHDEIDLPQSSPFTALATVHESDSWFRRADGTLACLLVSAVPVQGHDGRPAGARGVCRDVTEARERDAALARALHRERTANPDY